ncbi:recombinase family protein [Pseudoflavonifractor phocaeensis]|uniref:recombinase family protein n=1 Tax=Pseudoflavonifractor phocaeensis TaxID=1870988 RepID=UPI00195F1574|nr:recombinase family protein [Pseudoflavonifractor phocaeensis]MBM6869271.1 recombinase family protein [Pseudoflavonifractor phocaeensis]
METKLAAAYIRVSTEDQAEYSPDAQLSEIRKYADAHGYRLPQAFVFVDEGISGKHTGKRPGFQQMIGLAKTKPKPFEAILLWKFSRFARNREDSIVYKSMLRRQLGIDVISISEPLGDDKTSILMEAIIEAMDEYYSINLAEEVKRGMTEKARRGGLQNSPPFGYRAEGNLLRPIPQEAALVRELFRRFAGGQGLFPLAKWLNSLGVTTHRGGRFENRTVEYILRNPAYLGKLRWNPTGRTNRDFDSADLILADAGHEAIVSQELWDAVQARMLQVKAQHKYHGRPLSEHRDWVSGLVRCVNCGSTLVFAKPHYWKCNGYVRGRCKTAQHISDEKLKGMILTRMGYDAAGGPALTYTIVHPHTGGLDEEALIRAQQKQLTARLGRLREAYLAGVEDLEGYKTAKKAMDAELAALDARLAKLTHLPNQEAETPEAEPFRCAVLLADPEQPLELKKAAAHAIMDRCTLDKEANRLEIYYRLYLPE